MSCAGSGGDDEFAGGGAGLHVGVGLADPVELVRTIVEEQLDDITEEPEIAANPRQQ